MSQATDSTSPHRPRRGRAGAMGVVSATGSIVVHVLLLMVFGAVVWRTASPAGPRGPDVAIDFRAPAVGESAVAVGGATGPAGEREVVREVEVVLDEPVSSAAAQVPALESLATASPGAPAAEPAASGLLLESLAFSAEGPRRESGRAEASAGEAGGSAERVRFAGLGASNARSVVYVIDASGSMVTSLPCVMAEVERSVAGLSATQKFGVVLFRQMPDGTSGDEVFAPVLVRATPSARRRLGEWLAGVQPAGRSVPLSGLERAMEYKPEAVFLLSRSIERSGGNVWGRGLGETLARIDAMNGAGSDGRRPAVIQTIQFLDDDPTGTMQEIGRLHGARTDGSGRTIAGYRVIQRCEELGGGR